MPESTRRLQEGITRRGENELWTPYNYLAVLGLSPFEEWVLDWFRKLSTERPPAEGGVREIPFSKLEERLEKLGLFGTPEGEDILELWRRMDGEYCSGWNQHFASEREKHLRKTKPSKVGSLGDA